MSKFKQWFGAAVYGNSVTYSVTYKTFEGHERKINWNLEKGICF